MTLPSWLKEGGLVWSRTNRWQPWVKYRVRGIKRSSTCYSGWMVTLQKLEPPFWKEGRHVDSSFCHEAKEGEPAPGAEPQREEHMVFKMEIELGNDAMQTYEDLARSLEKTASKLRDYADPPDTNGGRIIDMNGLAVGRWRVGKE